MFCGMAENIENVSYDIFEWFPITICQDIFKYLNAKDLLEASAVNQEWNKLCNESAQTKNLKVVFKASPSTDVIDIMRSSKKRYQHVEFINFTTEDWQLILPFLADKAGCWKSVHLKACVDIDQDSWAEFIRIIEPTIETIRFNLKRCPVEAVNVDPTWRFPCLKLLKIDYCDYNIYKYFVHCVSVVNFRFFPPEEEMREDVRTILRNNQGLKNVDTCDTGLLSETPSSFNFKLQKLKMLMLCYSLDAGMVHRFLQTHALTLKTLKLNEKYNQECLQLILGMPKLSSLSIDFNGIHEAISTWRGQFPVNKTITALKVTQGISDGIQNSFEILIRALTCLKDFKCGVMTDELLLALSRAAPNLESLECKRFDVSSLPEDDLFPNMKEFKGGWISEDFVMNWQEPTGDNNFATLVGREM